MNPNHAGGRGSRRAAHDGDDAGGRGSRRAAYAGDDRHRAAHPEVRPPTARRFLGISREPIYSPGKADDDRAILQAVADTLAARHDVRLLDAADGLPEDPRADVVFTMAQGPAALAVTRAWQSRGIRVINTPAAIEGCHRHRLIAMLAHAGVPQPPSVAVATRAPERLPPWVGGGAWIKRGDVHAIDTDDVVHAPDSAAVAAALERFDRRGVTTAVIQRHERGDVIKFYAVRGAYFTWFPSAPHPPPLSPAAVAALRALAEHGARALGLEIFGGDCVLQADGVPLLIDLNDWPSYGRCRLEAADAIARYIAMPSR